VGILTGEIELVGTDVRGLAVHEAARVSGAVTTGQVRVSATTKLLLAGSALSFESAGIHHLKGLGEAYELFKFAGSQQETSRQR
jgi:class 3 adenylate cyclase